MDSQTHIGNIYPIVTVYE